MDWETKQKLKASLYIVIPLIMIVIIVLIEMHQITKEVQ